MTPMRAWQPLSEEEFEEALDRFGPSSFTVRPIADFLDDWLTGSTTKLDRLDGPVRLIILEALQGVITPQPVSARPDASEIRDATRADLCRQAVTRIERLRRLKEAGAPEILRRNERRMLGATARALLMAPAAEGTLQAAVGI